MTWIDQKEQNPILSDRINSILGKYSQAFSFQEESNGVSNSNNPFFNNRVNSFSPDNEILLPVKATKQSKFVKLIQNILSSPCSKLHPSPFRFERSVKAASHNSELQKEFYGNVVKIFSSLQRSYTHYGSDLGIFNFEKKLFSKLTND